MRTIRSASNAGHSAVLLPNAENLAEVLSVLQPNRTLYGEYIELVRRVLPTVKHVSVVPAPNNLVEIRIWNVEESSKRDDLTVPLMNCGTGVGQVLALLYVVARTSGSIIIIDEPNSFLHPGAARALMGILREHQGHQFIISTHSPEVISSSEPEKLLMLKFAEERTSIQEVDSSDLSAARQVLEEIGSRLSDVLGMDAVVWVEGPTETDCFPILLAFADRKLHAGEVIAPLRSTGELEGEHAELVAEIYRNISAAGALFPAHMVVSFDGDKQQHPEAKALETALGKIMRFLPRYCYENYLLVPSAIAAVLNTLPALAEEKTNQDAVTKWIEENGNSPKFGAQDVKPGSGEWLKMVDGARVLTRIFSEMSRTKQSYDKRVHGLAMTLWLVENRPEDIKELADYVVNLLPKK